jgi:two-component system, response regulator PdtaR
MPRGNAAQDFDDADLLPLMGTTLVPVGLPPMIVTAPAPKPAVLVVEDEPLVRNVVTEYLSDRGLKVVQAENAIMALALLKSRPDVKLLFTDINMPGLDGLALAREVHRRWPSMLVMLTSGCVFSSTELPPEAEFFPKPYDFERVADRIQKLLRGAGS